MGGVCITFFLTKKNCNNSVVFTISFIFLFPYRTVLLFWFGLWSLAYQTFFTIFHYFNLSFFLFFFFCNAKDWQGWKFGYFVLVLSNGG